MAETIKFALTKEENIFELSPMLWNISTSPFLRVNVSFMTTSRTGRILTILARSPDDVLRNVFVGTIQVQDEHLGLRIIDAKERPLVQYESKDTISIDGTDNEMTFLWNLTSNAFTIDGATGTVNVNSVLDFEVLQVHLSIGDYGTSEALYSEGSITIDGLDDMEDTISDGNGTFEDSSYMDKLTKLLQASNISAAEIMDKIKNIEEKTNKRLRQLCTAHEKSQCVNAENCKRNSDKATFNCICKYGYGGTYCQFSLFPRTCHEAIDMNNKTAGVMEIDLDGAGVMPATFVNCTEKGETIVETNVPKDVVIRSAEDKGSKYFPVMYSLFSYQQLELLKDISSHCVQEVSYSCSGAPLRFDKNATWFESVGYDFQIRSLGSEGRYFGCDCSKANLCKTCYCDNITLNSKDTGRFLNEKAGISKIYSKTIHPTYGQGLFNLGPLVCSGHRGHSSTFSFTFTSKNAYVEIGYRENVRYLQLEFRTAMYNIEKLISGYDDRHGNFTISLQNGHKVKFEYYKGTKSATNVSMVLEAPLKLNDLKWHRVVVEVVKEEVRLAVDEYNEYQLAKDFIALSMAVYVGGYKGSGIVGCVRNVMINQQLEAPGFETGGVKYGCVNSCENTTCPEQMKCVEDFVNSSGHCECKDSLTQYGERCEFDINVDSEISFHDANSAFLQYVNDELPSNPLTSNLVLSFRTDQRKALLLYAHDQFDNFIQIHLQSEYRLVLTISNESEVKSCEVMASYSNDFSKMRWIQLSVKQRPDSIIFEADGSICEIKGQHILSQRPILNFTGDTENMIYLPHSPVPIIAVHRYLTLFIGGVPRMTNSKERRFRGVRRAYYDSQLPSLMGCVRGVAFPDKNKGKNQLNTKIGGFKKENSELIQMGCSNACDLIKCQNGGFCAIEWHQTLRSSLTKVGCNCGRTSFLGQDCSRDYGLRFDGQTSLGYDVSKGMGNIKDDSLEQRISFAFNTKNARKLRAEQRLMTFSFMKDRLFQITLCKNGSLLFGYRSDGSVATTISGNFSDGTRHFIQLHFDTFRPVEILVDGQVTELEIDSDLNELEEVWMGSATPEELEKATRATTQKFEGCVSNLLLTFYGENTVSLTPTKDYLDWTLNDKDDFYLHPEGVRAITPAQCGEFEKPGKLPVEQIHIQLPVWDAPFEPIYFNTTVTIVPHTTIKYDWLIIAVAVLFIFFATALILGVSYLFFVARAPKKGQKGIKNCSHNFMSTTDQRKSQTPLLSESPTTLADHDLASDTYSDISDRLRLESPNPRPLSTFRSLNSNDLIQQSSLPIIGEAAEEISYADGE
ncbi:unnamed protein product [Bursaphelenchus okinawaensis]|uniref:Uncharacterized protein n=1 Tax=Bursaphelenchus okinawaensis TaxID=465554 RepID=A0A811JQ15_9BILA|nr:unnamed protein product [Bursaphelenchus okinawaensis]CAG9077133.1 unnamed protein product [Bursaphelenchus okinawaensis]